MNETYSISDLSREFEITTRTIRHYEEKGLLSPQRQGQTRIYNRRDRTRLKLILRGSRLGFSLDDTRQILDLYSPDDANLDQFQAILEKIREQRARLHQQQQDIEMMLTDLADFEAVCQQSLKQLSS